MWLSPGEGIRIKNPESGLEGEEGGSLDGRMSNRAAFRCAAILGFLAVCLGAFGAHGLKDVLSRNGSAAVWQTAALYHLVHAVVLLLVAQRIPFARGAWICMGGGVLVFSGSLYVLAVSDLKWLGAVTPIGGLFLLGGWIALALKR